MTSFFNIGLHTDYNFEYGDQIWRLASLGGHLASTTAIINPNDPWKAAPAILAAKRPTVRVYNVEQAMVGTDEGISGMNDAELKVRARQNAQWAVAAIEPLFAVYPGAYWQWYRNEVGNFGKARFYKFENIAWIEELAAHGQLASAFGFSVGTPELHIWPEFDDVMAALNNAHGQAAIHEYSLNGKDMRSAFDPAKGTGYHVGRYRMVWAQQRYPTRFPNVRWKIKELGMDFDVTVNPPTGGSWKGRITPQSYINELFWVNDTLLVPDGVAADVYQLGRDTVWSGYDVYGDVLNGLIVKISASTPNLIANTTPPPDPKPDPKPDPEPDPEPAPAELIVNGDFSGGTYSVPGNPDQRVVPSGWRASDTKVRVEIEMDPRFHPPSARIIEAYENREIGLVQDIAVEPGATYRVTARVAGWCTADASSPFSPSTSDATIRLRVNGTEAGSLPVQPGDLPMSFGTITRDVVATVDRWAVMTSIKPQYKMSRTDLRIDSVSVVKIKAPAPAPKGDRQVLVVSEVNHRAEPAIGSAWLGTFRPGAKPTVTGDVVNGYVQEKFYGVWILSANLKGV